MAGLGSLYTERIVLFYWYLVTRHEYVRSMKYVSGSNELLGVRHLVVFVRLSFNLIDPVPFFGAFFLFLLDVLAQLLIHTFKQFDSVLFESLVLILDRLVERQTLLQPFPTSNQRRMSFRFRRFVFRLCFLWRLLLVREQI